MTEQISMPRGAQEFDEDSTWFHSNISKLREMKLSGEFVAIKNKEVISHDRDIKNVVISVEKMGENPAYLVIEFVYPEGTVILL